MARTSSNIAELAKRIEHLEAEVRALRAEIRPKSHLRSAVETMWQTSRVEDVRAVNKAIRAARAGSGRRSA